MNSQSIGLGTIEFYYRDLNQQREDVRREKLFIQYQTYNCFILGQTKLTVNSIKLLAI